MTDFMGRTVCVSIGCIFPDTIQLYICIRSDLPVFHAILFIKFLRIHNNAISRIINKQDAESHHVNFIYCKQVWPWLRAYTIYVHRPAYPRSGSRTIQWYAVMTRFRQPFWLNVKCYCYFFKCITQLGH